MLDGFLRRTGAPGPIAWDRAARRTSLLRTSAIFALGFLLCGTVLAEGVGNAAAIEGVVSDPTGAVVPGATVQIQNPVSKLEPSATTDADGHFSFPNVAPNNYHLSVTAQGFVSYAEDVGVRSAEPLSLKITLQVGGLADVKELALYLQDNIAVKTWNFSLGIRGDLYNGVTVASQAEPRLGVTYNIHRTNTVLHLSYARTLDTPYNENLVFSSKGCFSPVIAAQAPCVPAPLSPGYRHEFHAGFQQALGKYVVMSGHYIWKYTHNAFDFSVLANPPITFPIEWHNWKIPGWALRVSVPKYHGFTDALALMSSVASRFFPPQVGGLGTTVESGGYPFGKVQGRDTDATA